MQSRKVRFAVVGFGHIGKRHASMIYANKEAELLSVADIEQDKKCEVEEKYNVPFFSSLDELLKSKIQPDVIDLCTPNNMHAVQCIQILNDNKHVVCEKPMALRKTDCEKVIENMNIVNKQVFCVMQNRYSPPSRWLKEMIDSNRPGEIFMVQINCFWNRDERYYKHSSWKGKKEQDGGTLFTQFSHFIDIMYWLFGDITNINARFRDFNHQHLTDFEDSGYITFDFVKGGMGNINYSTSVYNTNFESSITIIGNKGTIKVGGQYMNEIIYCDVENYDRPDIQESGPPNDYGNYKGSAANHHYLFHEVIDHVKGNKLFKDNTHDAMKVVDIIERIYNSSK